MDYLWTPWRYRYIADATKDEGCVFCAAVAMNNDPEALIVFRGAKNFVILNRYPYTSIPRTCLPSNPARSPR